MITQFQELKELALKLKNEPQIGIDTEFLWRSTYYPKLCLMQISTANDCYIIDPLAQDIDLSPLKPLLENQKILKIFHACSQDLKILYKEINAKVYPIFDTQIAAEFIGFNHQTSLQNLLSYLEITELEKTETMTNWCKRPLSAKQIKYAQEDVAYLIAAFKKLNKLLTTEKKLNWLLEDFKAFYQNEQNYAYTAPEMAYQKLSAYKRCDSQGKFILKNLCYWREKLAQTENICQQWIISNKSIIEIARKKPESLNQLRSNQFHLKPKQINKYQQQILEILQASKGITIIKNIVEKNDTHISSELVQETATALAAQCEEYNIIPQTVATKSEIKKFLASEKQAGQLASGWRYKYFGQKL